MGEREDDGKIRIRCTGCGKRVKFPAGMPGQTYRCPLCHTTIIAPIGNGEEASAAASSPPPQPAPEIPLKAPQQGPAMRPERIQKNNEPAVDRFNAFVLKATYRMQSLANAAMIPSEETPAQLAARLNELRHVRALQIKDYAHAMLRDMDKAIAELKESPAAGTDSVRTRLERLLTERRNFLLYLNVMFELRPSAAARQDTPGSAEAPPTTPAQQAPQKPQGTPPASPEQGGTAPGSSLS